MVTAPTLEAFGHGSVTQLGRKASGGRPLLIVLGEYSNFPAFSTVHPLEYYERLGFGTPTSPFSTDDPVNPASLREYFREISNGRFWFDRVAVAGPISLGPYADDPGPEARSAGILSRVAAQAPEFFVNADTNLDHQVAFDELCVVLVENITGAWPANRDNNPVHFTIERFPLTPWDETIRVHVAGAGPLTPFYQIAHELSHSLGTVDMYNTGLGNNLLTLMGTYSFFGNDQGIVHLDIWHKLVLGWAEPRRFPLSASGSAPVTTGVDGAILLWDETRQATEYFIIERRSPNSPRLQYDAGFPDDGVLIWRVQQGVGNGVAHLGAPDLAPGGAGVWRAGQQTPTLTWSDGQSTGVDVTVTGGADGAVQVAWRQQATQDSSRHLMLTHGGNGTTPVDSGLPMQGIFYGITADGNLEWNRYNGRGEPVGDPASAQNWHANTGNLIGRGAGHMKHVFGCGDGVLMMVHPNGNLHWYSYAGNGESDVTGTLGWHPNSGNVIGNGAQNLRKIFVFPQAGRSTSRMKMLAIHVNGDLYWYSYSGNGEHDPSGSLGWHPNSGNRVGNGWQNARHVHGSGNVVFVVHTNGNLLWYSYSGQGENDPSGALGWHPNSGNPVGRGWQNMRHVFGGVTDLGGFGHVIFAVDQVGDLRWYRYTGQGEADVTGTQGWHPNSGTRIGTHW
ncbi:tachylectin-related carbohydrate-binding protein [Flindersiella endophytica]